MRVPHGGTKVGKICIFVSDFLNECRAPSPHVSLLYNFIIIGVLIFTSPNHPFSRTFAHYLYMIDLNQPNGLTHIHLQQIQTFSVHGRRSMPDFAIDRLTVGLFEILLHTSPRLCIVLSGPGQIRTTPAHVHERWLGNGSITPMAALCLIATDTALFAHGGSSTFCIFIRYRHVFEISFRTFPLEANQFFSFFSLLSPPTKFRPMQKVNLV